MRTDVDQRLTAGRLRASDAGDWYGEGLNGSFEVQGPCGAVLRIIASTADFPDSEGWEHVSVSTRRRCPNWQEMCFVKDLFWGPEETVFQLHPPRSEYVNNHPYCLHIWRHVIFGPPKPPAWMVGDPALGELKA